MASPSSRDRPYLMGMYADQWRPVWERQQDNPIWVTPDTDQGVDIQDDGSVRAVCIDEQGRIWGEQTLLDPTLDEWPGWSGFVELAGERFAARVRIERFDSANNQVVKVAAIRASTPPGWVPVDSQ